MEGVEPLNRDKISALLLLLVDEGAEEDEEGVISFEPKMSANRS